MKYRQNREIAYRTIEGSAVLFDTARGMMRQLNPQGTELWELLEKDQSLGDLALFLVNNYQIDERSARHDVDTFLAALLERELILMVPE